MELIFQDQDASGALDIVNGTEYWVKVWAYRDSTDYPASPTSFQQIIFQIHGADDTNPLFSLNLYNTQYRVTIKADDDYESPGDPAFERNSFYDNLGAWASDNDTWVEWIFHFKMDYDGGSNYMDIYKDGILWWEDPLAGGAGAANGMGYYESGDPYLQVGLYDFDCDSTSDRYIRYLDDIKIGDSSETLSSMSDNPTGGAITISNINGPGAVTISNINGPGAITPSY